MKRLYCQQIIFYFMLFSASRKLLISILILGLLIIVNWRLWGKKTWCLILHSENDD
jgi:predicted negative regulator of RcsB-dependent stress response